MRKDETKYVSEDEAKILARKWTREYEETVTCPMMRGSCDSDCVCFKRPEPEKVGKAKKWTLSSWGCTNPMLGQGGTSGE